MIAYVSGTLAEKKPTNVVVDVQGVGYSLQIPTSTFERLPAEGEAVKLFTHQHVREDALLLFGFSSRSERSVFETVISVSGIGPKLALAALSTMPASELCNRVIESDVGYLTRIPGVGKKVAERMVVELRDRMASIEGILVKSGASEGGVDSKGQARADALAALEALGISRAAAERSIRKVLRNQPEVGSAEELISAGTTGALGTAIRIPVRAN